MEQNEVARSASHEEAEREPLRETSCVADDLRARWTRELLSHIAISIHSRVLRPDPRAPAGGGQALILRRALAEFKQLPVRSLFKLRLTCDNTFYNIDSTGKLLEHQNSHTVSTPPELVTSNATPGKP